PAQRGTAVGAAGEPGRAEEQLADHAPAPTQADPAGPAARRRPHEAGEVAVARVPELLDHRLAPGRDGHDGAGDQRATPPSGPADPPDLPRAGAERHG